MAPRDDVRACRTMLLVLPRMLANILVERKGATSEPGNLVAPLKWDGTLQGRHRCHRECSLRSRACAMRESPAGARPVRRRTFASDLAAKQTKPARMPRFFRRW